MNIYDATEVAYKNGYAAALAEDRITTAVCRGLQIAMVCDVHRCPGMDFCVPCKCITNQIIKEEG